MSRDQEPRRLGSKSDLDCVHERSSDGLTLRKRLLGNPLSQRDDLLGWLDARQGSSHFTLPVHEDQPGKALYAPFPEIFGSIAATVIDHQTSEALQRFLHGRIGEGPPLQVWADPSPVSRGLDEHRRPTEPRLFNGLRRVVLKSDRIALAP